jgi:iron complex transport system substrate-binding protein
VEKYASLRPDLLVAGMYQPNTLWYVPEESPAALGADPEAAPVAETRFDAASAALKTLAAARGNLEKSRDDVVDRPEWRREGAAPGS